MRMFLIAALLIVITTFVAFEPHAQTVNDTARATQQLEARLFAEKHIYRRGDKIRLTAMVINTSDQDIFVYGNLEWGYSASFTLYVRDAKGKSVQPNFIDDAITYPPNDKTQFVRLLPYHSLGTFYHSSTEELNIQRPGRYSMSIEYHSPVSRSKADVSPFYGKENGVIRSNPIWIQVQ